jgi:preprotein translocase subunit Sss1
MTILNSVPENHDYDGLNENSSDLDRLDKFFAILLKTPHGEYVDTWKLKIKHNQQSYFEALLLDTGLVVDGSGSAEQTRLKLTSKAIVLLNKYGSYSNYKHEIDNHNIKQSQDASYEKELKNQINTLTLDALKREALNAELDRKLKESQQKINELSLIKKPTWRERHWLLIALVSALLAGVFGFLLDIGKEATKKRLWPDKTESKTQIQEKSNTVPLHK